MDVAANNNPGPSTASPFRERDIAFDPVVIALHDPTHLTQLAR